MLRYIMKSVISWSFQFGDRKVNYVEKLRFLILNSNVNYIDTKPFFF